jgi:ABC-type branched-subunit amino acid transport system ATPase component
MLNLENIATGYKNKQVLFDVSFTVNKGDIVLLAGSNGSGKSTLLKAIYGILPQWYKGQITFNGEIITEKPSSSLLKKGLLYIPQTQNLFESLTVKENLEIAGIMLERKLLYRRIENVLAMFTTLVPHINRTPLKLSGGERQLLTLAMATLHQPKMILVDEPFAGLSPQNISFVTQKLKTLNETEGITLLIVEHRVKECLQISNRVISLKLGSVFSNFEINTKFDINELNSVFI